MALPRAIGPKRSQGGFCLRSKLKRAFLATVFLVVANAVPAVSFEGLSVEERRTVVFWAECAASVYHNGALRGRCEVIPV